MTGVQWQTHGHYIVRCETPDGLVVLEVEMMMQPAGLHEPVPVDTRCWVGGHEGDAHMACAVRAAWWDDVMAAWAAEVSDG